MTANSEGPGTAENHGSKADAILVALEGLLRLERASKEGYGSRRDSDSRDLFLDAKYTAIWLASAIPQLREFLAANRVPGDELAAEVLSKLNYLRDGETPDYGWRQVVRVVAETFSFDEETRERWASKPKAP